MRNNGAVDELLSCRFVSDAVSANRADFFLFSCKESVGESEDWSEEGYNCTTTTVRLKLIIILLLIEGSF